MKSLSSSKMTSFNLKRLRNQIFSGQSSGIKGVDGKDKFQQLAQQFGDTHSFRAAGNYSYHFLPNTKYLKEKVQLLGNTARVFGFVDDDYNSNDTLLNGIESKNPDAIILGGLSYTDMEFLRKGNLKYMNAPRLANVSMEQALAKKQFARFFETDMDQTGRYFYEMDDEANDYTVFETDKILKRKMAKPEISTAKYACSTANKKLFFGAPNPLLVIEELAYSLSLQELKDVFNDTLQTYHEMGEQMQVIPSEHPIDLHNNLRQIAMNKHWESLYDKQLTYTASLLRKCSKLYKETSVTIDNHLVKPLKQYALNPDTPEIEEIFSRRFEGELNRAEIIEKLIILNHLFSRELSLYLEGGQEQALSEVLFKGQLKDNGSFQYQYNRANQPYRKQLQRMFDDDIGRLKYLPPSGRNLIETYDAAMTRFELKQQRTYRFITNPARERAQLIFMYQKLLEKIDDNINKREREGISQRDTRVLLNQLLIDGNPTPENLQLYRELVVEANTQLGLFTMPDSMFAKYKEIVKMTSYESMKEVLGEDPRKFYKREQIVADNKRERGILTQLSDGSVPSFEQFKVIKDKIQKTNQGIGANFSMIKIKETQESLEQQYLKLEQMARDFPKARERIEKLKEELKLTPIQNAMLEQVEAQSSIFLDEKGNAKTLDQIEPNKNIVYSMDGEPLPFDITNKTVEELRKIGFTDVLSVDLKHDSVTGSAKPYMNPEEKRRVLDLANKMQEDMNDPDSHLDTMGDQIDENESLDRPKSEKDKILFQKIKKQKQIDDNHIQLVYKALEKGIPLEGDFLYVELLEMYPYYQEKLRDRQRLINKIKREKENIEKQGKPIRYGFEKQIKGKSNLSFIDVETVNESDEGQIDYAHYESILKQYESDMKEIKIMSSAIESDVITEKDAEIDIQRHEQEELRTEQMLGKRFLTEVDPSEGGSTLEEINQKHQPELMMQQFLEEMKEEMKPLEKAAQKSRM